MPEGTVTKLDLHSTTRLRVLLVEDHLILRQGLRALLETNSDIEIVGEAGTVADALAQAQATQPAIVITDIGLPDCPGIELVAELRARHPQTRVLVLTAYSTEEHIRAALTAGASGYVLKDASHAELVQGLRAVSAGRRFLCESIEARVLSRYAAGAEPAPTLTPSRVTKREREVLTRIALGQTNKYIARSLDLSVKTVEKHRSNVMRKLNLHNTAAVTLFAVRHRLLDQVGILDSG
jgi:DNA-binding NarL/FixJ family response regulator